MNVLICWLLHRKHHRVFHAPSYLTVGPSIIVWQCSKCERSWTEVEEP